MQTLETPAIIEVQQLEQVFENPWVNTLPPTMLPTNIVKVWIRRHVEGGDAIEVLKHSPTEFMVRTCDPMLIARVSIMLEKIKEKGTP
mgnify:FL=1